VVAWTTGEADVEVRLRFLVTIATGDGLGARIT